MEETMNKAAQPSRIELIIEEQNSQNARLSELVTIMESKLDILLGDPKDENKGSDRDESMGAIDQINEKLAFTNELIHNLDTQVERLKTLV